MELAVAAVAPAALALDKHPALVVAVSGKTLSASATALDTASEGALANALAHAGFDGKAGQTLAAVQPARYQSGFSTDCRHGQLA